MSHVYHNRTGESISYGDESFKTFYTGEPACLCLEIQALQLDVLRWRRQQKYIRRGNRSPVPSRWQRTEATHKGAAPCSLVQLLPAGTAGSRGGSWDANRVVITSLWKMRLGTGSC